jgi:hypothetical protein
MTQQNDGVALYECDNITVNDNIVNWNCGFGIRMTPLIIVLSIITTVPMSNASRPERLRSYSADYLQS